MSYIIKTISMRASSPTITKSYTKISSKGH